MYLPEVDLDELLTQLRHWTTYHGEHENHTFATYVFQSSNAEPGV